LICPGLYSRRFVDVKSDVTHIQTQGLTAKHFILQTFVNMAAVHIRYNKVS
jgi:hypothetical protein